MDEHGWFNFGPGGSHLKAVCECAKTVIVEVNKNMPVCLGGFDNCIHIDDVDMIVEGENPILDELGGGGAASEVDLAVANLVVPEICDGACLQLGIGSMPNAIGKMIAESDLKDLGVHTEMYVDAFVDMSMAGRITGLRKPFDRGRQTYAFAAGTRKLYDFIDNNPGCMAAPVSYVNDIARVSQIDNFISINGAVDVDLYGQVSSESSGTHHISGAGGQQDFVMGAYPVQGRQELHLLLLLLYGQEDRPAEVPHPAHPAGGLCGHRHPHQPPLCGHRVRQVQRQGQVHLGAG